MIYVFLTWYCTLNVSGLYLNATGVLQNVKMLWEIISVTMRHICNAILIRHPVSIYYVIVNSRDECIRENNALVRVRVA